MDPSMGVRPGRERRAISEVVGTVILVGVVMAGVALVGILLLSSPPPTKVPSFDAIISNRSKTVYIYHKGGDPLSAGEYRIFVDNVDQTAAFSIMSPGTEPWSVGETLTATLTTMPRHVAIGLIQAGGGVSIIMESDLNSIVKMPALHPSPPSVGWSPVSPALGNISTLFQFTDTSTGRNITSYSWNFHDGTIPSANRNEAHSFPCTDEYCTFPIDHSATDSGGSDWETTSWLNRSNWVTAFRNLTPNVTFTQDKTSGPAGFLTVNFIGTQIGNIRIDNWYWEFGDGGTLNTQNPSASHAYTAKGVYTVNLTATNSTL
ncbi:MAG TPA: PKD domain-containing protein, partial [Methanomicrobiales archaeon]|nr:PKD domain-containing protein [Methanomicrobiales archaeon]